MKDIEPVEMDVINEHVWDRLTDLSIQYNEKYNKK